MSLFFGSGMIGIFIGFFFSLMYIQFDKDWKRIVTLIIPTGGTVVGIWLLYQFADIEKSQLFTHIGVTIMAFLVTFVVFMFATCHLIKDKDDTDILRIRDIFLGQKSYIKAYYDIRKKEIDKKLNFDILKEREAAIKDREAKLQLREDILKQEEDQLNSMTKSKLKIELPDHKKLLVTKNFLDSIPQYAFDLSTYATKVGVTTNQFIESNDEKGKLSITLDDLKNYLTNLSIQIVDSLFGGQTRGVRVHFRFYDPNRNGYEKLISVLGGKQSKKNMTFIPYDKANMIIKSCECKRALIKSNNPDYDYQGNNYTTWTEYITLAFYNIQYNNIQYNNIPCLSFGISVKDAHRYRQQLCFLNYCKFEECLQEAIENIDEKYDIKTVLYGE